MFAYGGLKLILLNPNLVLCFCTGSCGPISNFIFRTTTEAERGVVVEWLERLDYDAKSRRKVVSSRLGFAMRRLQNSLCQPSSKRVPFRIRAG